MEGKGLIKRRFSHHLEGYDALSVVQRSVCARLDALAEQYVESPENGLAIELGAGTGFLTRYLLSRYPGKEWTINDIVPEVEPFILRVKEDIGYNGSIKFLWGDAESVMLPENVTLIASASLFQWFDRLDLFLKKRGSNLVSGGYMLFSSFGEDNFFEIREASEGNKGIAFPRYSEVLDWCRDAGFDVLYSDFYIDRMYFPSVRQMLYYLKETGVNGDSRGRWLRSEYIGFCRRYEESFTTSQGVSLSFNPLLFVLKKR